MSYSISLSARWYNVGFKSLLRNSHVSVEKFVTSVNLLPATNGRKCPTVHKTVMHSRQLAYATTRLTSPYSCVSAAPVPAILASVCNENGFPQSGFARIGIGPFRGSMTRYLWCWVPVVGYQRKVQHCFSERALNFVTLQNTPLHDIRRQSFCGFFLWYY